MKQSLLLHVCCATCAAHVLKLLQHDFEVTAYYYNPNIYPEKEYAIRFQEVQRYCEQQGIPFIEEDPDQDRWFALTKGHKQDPERGERCMICYRMRLQKTAEYACEKNFDLFGTDLSISPHKDAGRLNAIGKELAQQFSTQYLEADFKKQDGFKKAMCISREQGFYRQNYCGCVYSLEALK